MKIIEALKEIKNLRRKLGDIQEKISIYSADNSTDTPIYENQKLQIESWLQAAEDINKNILNLSHRIHKTNVNTKMTIEVIDGKPITKSIDEWLLRMFNLAEEDKKTWLSLNVNDSSKTQKYRLPNSSTDVVVTRRLYFDILKRDKKLEEYSSEKSKINSKLEIINAITDLLD